jgi:hypothetical protein
MSTLLLLAVIALEVANLFIAAGIRARIGELRAVSEPDESAPSRRYLDEGR